MFSEVSTNCNKSIQTCGGIKSGSYDLCEDIQTNCGYFISGSLAGDVITQKRHMTNIGLGQIPTKPVIRHSDFELSEKKLAG